MGIWGDINQTVQVFSYKRRVSPGDLLYSITPIGNNAILYTLKCLQDSRP